MTASPASSKSASICSRRTTCRRARCATGSRAPGVFVVSLVSSPGAGKTAFLERTLTALAPTCRVAALVGDLATENDAARLARSGAPVKQIVTGTVCHLEAEMVDRALADWRLADLDLLFIENVGNLVCPVVVRPGRGAAPGAAVGHRGRRQAAQVPDDLQHRRRGRRHQDRHGRGRRLRPRRAARATSSASAPACRIFEVSAKSGAGMDDWLRFIAGRARRVASPHVLDGWITGLGGGG